MSQEERTPESLSFEEAMESLDSIVSSLEDGNLPLEEMVGAYERGMTLLRVCRSRIDSARLRVEAINLNLEAKEKQAQATLTEFAALDTPESSAPPAQQAAPKRAPAKKKESEDPPEVDSDEIRLF